jgi:hypothetical protein
MLNESFVSVPHDLLRAIADVWRIPSNAPSNLFSQPAFRALCETCKRIYPNVGSGSTMRFALSEALRSLGPPCHIAPEDAQLRLSPEFAAQSLDEAFRCTNSSRVHLCPLNLADDFPALAFGPNRVARFSASELDQIVDSLRLRRINRSWTFDSKRFSKFAWLVVNEEVQLSERPEARSLPVLFYNLNDDFGRIVPHKSRIPPIVEAALFALLTIPWENLVRYREIEWRGFDVPWVYTIDKDIFTRPTEPPSADTLAWEPDVCIDQSGAEFEDERPTTLPINDGVDSDLLWLNDMAWSEVIRARKSAIFPDTVGHFFVRAFLSEGIDEFLAHITAVEAALSLPIDHDVNRRRKLMGGKNPGATFRVASRVAALLDSKADGDTYRSLFNLRSDFLHGRPMRDISGAMRVTARELARKVVCALLGAALSSAAEGSRDQYLDGLLDVGPTRRSL